MKVKKQETIQNTEVSAKKWGLAAACMGNVIWGFTYLFTRIAMREASPMVILAVRFDITFLLLLMMVLSGRWQVSYRGKKVGCLLFFSILEPLYFFFESYCIYYTNATYAGVALAIAPILSIFLGALFLKEYPTRHQAVFSIFPVVGVILITMVGQRLGFVRPIGILFLFFTCLTSALNKPANRRSAEQFTPFERTFMMILISAAAYTGAVLVLLKGNVKELVRPLAVPGFLIPVLILSIVSSIGANMLINYAAGKLSVTMMATAGALCTLCSMFAGVIFLGEPMTVVSFIGSLLVLIGIWQVAKE